MSTNTSGRGRWRESAFAVGTFVGMVVFAIGIAVLVLAMSVGLRRGQEYLPPLVRNGLLVIGLVLFLGGVIVRLYRTRLTTQYESQLSVGSVIGTLIGAALVLFATAAETTVSAPFLASPREKVLLFAIAYGFIAVGLVILRAAARIVGW